MIYKGCWVCARKKQFLLICRFSAQLLLPENFLKSETALISMSQKQSRILNYTEPRCNYNKGAIYNIAKWRQKVLARDKMQCQVCLNSIKDIHRNRKIRNEAHHIIPRHHGGKNTLSNGVTLCTFCHDYFDYSYFSRGIDFFEITKAKDKEGITKEVRKMIGKIYVHHLLNILRK